MAPACVNWNNAGIGRLVRGLNGQLDSLQTMSYIHIYIHLYILYDSVGVDLVS